MPNDRRACVPGGTYFLTVVTHQRRYLFDREENRMLPGNAFRECKQNWPFKINAIVLLPDHLHAIHGTAPVEEIPIQRLQAPQARLASLRKQEGGQEPALRLTG